MGSPQLELRITVGAEPREIIVPAREEVNPGKRLRVAPIESLGQPHNCRQHPHRRAKGAVEIAVSLVRFLRGRLPMVAGDERDDLDLLRIEAPQISILDQVIGMPVVAVIADMHADIVQERGVFEPLPFAISESVYAAGLVEDAQCKARDLLRMLGPVPAPFPQLYNAAAPDVRVPLDLPDAGAVAVNVIEDQAFPKRQVAERQVLGAKPSQNRVEKHRAGDVQISAPRIETGHLEALFDVRLDQPLS